MKNNNSAATTIAAAPRGVPEIPNQNDLMAAADRAAKRFPSLRVALEWIADRHRRAHQAKVAGTLASRIPDDADARLVVGAPKREIVQTDGTTLTIQTGAAMGEDLAAAMAWLRGKGIDYEVMRRVHAIASDAGVRAVIERMEDSAGQVHRDFWVFMLRRRPALQDAFRHDRSAMLRAAEVWKTARWISQYATELSADRLRKAAIATKPRIRSRTNARHARWEYEVHSVIHAWPNQCKALANAVKDGTKPE